MCAIWVGFYSLWLMIFNSFVFARGRKNKINSYPGAFAQILTNRVTNSITHGFRGGPGVINVSVESPGKELVLVYSDDGRGITPDVLPRIFDPFFTTDHAAGTGLGLHIVYNLVTQKLGGTITCESAEGEGVCFTITVPGQCLN